MKTREAIAILEEQGFVFTSKTGSHAKYKKDGSSPVIVPVHARDIAPSTLKRIWQQAGLYESLKHVKTMTEYREILSTRAPDPAP